MGEVEENSRENSAEKDSKPIEVGQIFGGLLFDLATVCKKKGSDVSGSLWLWPSLALFKIVLLCPLMSLVISAQVNPSEDELVIGRGPSDSPWYEAIKITCQVKKKCPFHLFIE